MIDLRTRAVRRPDADTLGALTTQQLLGLCEVAGLDRDDAASYARILTEALGSVAERPLDQPPPMLSELSDDHTPVEFSLSIAAGRTPSLRLLFEPAVGIGDLAQRGRAGLFVVRDLAERWGIATEQLDALEDLFFPEAPHGPFALWVALELRPGGIPQVKVYLNPAAAGQERSAATVREALRRLGHPQAFAALPESERHVFLALDLGDWEEPRVKVYTAHPDVTADRVADLNRMAGGPGDAEVEAFFRTAAGIEEGRDGRLDRRPALACHAFTETASGLPTGFTLHVPVRDYVRDDAEALDRAVVLLRRYGIDPTQLLDSLDAVTPRKLEDGVGLIAYLALAHQQGRPPRLTAYISSEAYQVRPPAALPRQAEPVH